MHDECPRHKKPGAGHHCWIMIVGWMMGIAGCSFEDPVEHYQIPKEASVYAENHVEASESSEMQAEGAPTGRGTMLGAASDATDIQFTRPEGWRSAAPDSFSLLALEAESDGQTARITVSRLPGSSGGLAANVTRWCRQAGAAPWTSDDLNKRAQPMTVSRIDGSYLRIEGQPSGDGETTAIDGWIGTHQGFTWFVKIKGNVSLVRAERETFQTFMKSLQFPLQ